MKAQSTWSLVLAFILTISAPLASSSSDPVSDTNSQVLTIPKNTKWPSSQLKGASDAQKFFYNQIKKEIAAQRKDGAIRLKKIYSAENTLEYPDWKTYVKDVRVYEIAGYNSSGELVRVSEPFPADMPNLATRTVYLKQDYCNLNGFNIFDFATWWSEDCQIHKDSPSTYLRAAMRTWLSMSENASSLAASYRQEISTCLSTGEEFSIKSGVFNCPGNAKYFFGTKPFKLKQQLLSGGFWFKVNKESRTATLTHLAPRYDAWAKTARWIASDKVTRFSND